MSAGASWDLGWADHALAILFGLAVPAASAFSARGREALEFDRPARIGLYWSTALQLAAAGLLVLCAAWLSGRSPRALGLRAPEPGTWGVGLAAAGIVLGSWAIDTVLQLVPQASLERTRARWRRDTPFLPTDRSEVLHSLGMVCSAAFFEELVFRAFLVGYVRSWLGEGAWADLPAVVAPALPFALAHLYQGTRAVAKIALLSVCLGSIFLWTGSLLLPIALHLVIDLAGVLLAPRLLSTRE